MKHTYWEKIYAHRLVFEISIGAVLYHEEKGKKKFLLLRYPHGHWDFVKGHKEKGESDEQTLRREVEEETGIHEITKIIKKPRKRIFYFYRAKGTEVPKRLSRGNGLYIYKQVVYYLAESSTIEVQISDEHIGWKWFSYDEAMARLSFDNSKKTLRKLMNDGNSSG